ncbi:tRNA (N6-isopentenyl adenosine(37)-C2)-methylthiotransferase MiaB [Arcanobacterium buesumense]|uniref:tRNA-2-methylthio-N(6)-dimethylallyladenosine synthase n=1 Tax=Arcanobacterium buesumense TaxID=2722751 RepID=A0A6H2EL91_9ACTO|nr:tRNA (N6-isopentenyl adenosine(37)-C2)-methylthiotransferase MiaB [Arcanobacterium buesumense]QJC21592.1 tRNA (N6-isopentenyl adenosine(37)-C2)-methylthiotransferase MiaB [Arcanobacterium buesumense]
MSEKPQTADVKTYAVRTLGCQMNVHDSERMAGLLDQAGIVPVELVPEKAARATEAGDQGADILVINTCSVRENAANKLFGHLGQLKSVKDARPDMQIAVGGCLAQQLREGIIERAPWVDVVLGTHNLDVLPVLLERARHNKKAAVEIEESLKVFPSTLPTHRESAYAAWVSISVGCNNTCTFCIVPHLRGKERDRRPGEILSEIQAVVDQGAIEITLLGQNVNSYGVGFGDRGAFAKLLRACGDINGLERVRFTSPHPAAFTDDVIDAMAETPNVMPSLHMPLQSGSDRVLRAMRRSYRSAKFLGILERVRERIPNAAITTDIIVGFPGETEEDFQQTLDIVEQSRFSSAFTFLYSPRPGTPAADMADQIPADVASNRYQRLHELQQRITLEENNKLVGERVDVLVSAGEGRKDAKTARITGRAADNRLVHIALPDNLVDMPRPGDLVSAVVTRAAPSHLVADSALTGGLFAIRPTRAGDAYEAGERRKAQLAEEAAGRAPVSLGIPSIGLRKS